MLVATEPSGWIGFSAAIGAAVVALGGVLYSARLVDHRTKEGTELQLKTQRSVADLTTGREQISAGTDRNAEFQMAKRKVYAAYLTALRYYIQTLSERPQDTEQARDRYVEAHDKVLLHVKEKELWDILLKLGGPGPV